MAFPVLLKPKRSLAARAAMVEHHEDLLAAGGRAGATGKSARPRVPAGGRVRLGISRPSGLRGNERRRLPGWGGLHDVRIALGRDEVRAEIERTRAARDDRSSGA